MMDGATIRPDVRVRDVTSENWRQTLELAVSPAQQRFVADYAPIALLALAKAYIRPGGMAGEPYAFYADSEAGRAMVGFALLAFEPDEESCWLFHFFVDVRYQGRGYGHAALRTLIANLRERHPTCQTFRLVVHPENAAAQRLYTSAGFRPTGEMCWGEPAYALPLYPK
jgi:diamine N-acetyltransferase